jgi:hypothetical protein
MTPEEVIAYAMKHTPTPTAVIAALASKGYVIVPKPAHLKPSQSFEGVLNSGFPVLFDDAEASHGRLKNPRRQGRRTGATHEKPIVFG